MIKIDSIKNYITPRARLFRMNFKRSINDAAEINRQDNVFKRISGDIKDMVSEVKESYTKGDVITAGVTDEKAKTMLDTSKDGLKAYAKANKIDIVFHTPQKPCECGANDFEKPLTITVDSRKGPFGSWCMRDKTVDGDIDNVTKYITEKKVKSGDSFVTVPSEKDETFLRRVYRTVAELKNQIDTAANSHK